MGKTNDFPPGNSITTHLPIYLGGIIMKKILSKILLICAVCISLAAGNAQIANAETAVPFYQCGADSSQILRKTGQSMCIFTPLESSTKTTFTFTSDDRYNEATINIESPANFRCANTSPLVPRGGTKEVDCTRTSGAAADIKVSLAETNLAESVKVNMKNIAPSTRKSRE